MVQITRGELELLKEKAEEAETMADQVLDIMINAYGDGSRWVKAATALAERTEWLSRRLEELCEEGGRRCRGRG